MTDGKTYESVHGLRAFAVGNVHLAEFGACVRYGRYLAGVRTPEVA